MKRTKFGFWHGFLDGLGAGFFWRRLLRKQETQALQLWSKQRVQMIQEANELREALDAAEKDAERYRWLKKNHALWMLYRFPPKRPWNDSAAEVDVAIDAAIAASKKENTK
jgi:hypothetical protein